ncbi:hypothetical protein ACRCPV_30510, partial [Pseudomonas aeruginosa]
FEAGVRFRGKRHLFGSGHSVVPDGLKVRPQSKIRVSLILHHELNHFGEHNWHPHCAHKEHHALLIRTQDHEAELLPVSFDKLCFAESHTLQPALLLKA